MTLPVFISDFDLFKRGRRIKESGTRLDLFWQKVPGPEGEEIQMIYSDASSIIRYHAIPLNDPRILEHIPKADDSVAIDGESGTEEDAPAAKKVLDAAIRDCVQGKTADWAKRQDTTVDAVPAEVIDGFEEICKAEVGGETQLSEPRYRIVITGAIRTGLRARAVPDDDDPAEIAEDEEDEEITEAQKETEDVEENIIDDEVMNNALDTFLRNELGTDNVIESRYDLFPKQNFRVTEE